MKHTVVLERQLIDYSNLGLDLEGLASPYFRMLLIRMFEQRLLDLFVRNEVFGTTHTSMGQEANAVGVIDALNRDSDIVWSNHRCHGHFLAYCGQISPLFAEILGRRTGVCGGRGGSQHLHWRNFTSSGIQGGLVAAAVGAAYAERDSGAISCVFLGDGTMGQGSIYEALNLASLWSAPVLFVIEDNEIAQTTPRSLGVAGSISERAMPFGVRSLSYEGTDVRDISEHARDLVSYVRAASRPAWFHIRTVRMGPHSKGDDTRSREEILLAQKKDPLCIIRSQLSSHDEIDSRCESLIEAALQQAQKAPLPCA